MKQGRHVRSRLTGSVLFHAAGGPRLGFGHVVRCLVLARALGVPPLVALDGGDRARRTARRLGCRLVEGSPRAATHRVRAALVVIDDPNVRRARAWCAAARAGGARVASLHDLGLARCPSDLAIDGSIARPRRRPSSRRALIGPRFAVIDPAVARLRRTHAAPRGSAAAVRVVIALGGGPRSAAALRIARTIASRQPEARVQIAGGFVSSGRATRLPNVAWLGPRAGLARDLAGATVAVVGGGVTLYEACGLGVPTVAVAVVPAQRRTVRGFAARHGVRASSDRQAGRHALALMADARARRRLSRVAARLVDGRGARRVAGALAALLEGRA